MSIFRRLGYFVRSYGKKVKSEKIPMENDRKYVMAYDFLLGQIQTDQLKGDMNMNELGVFSKTELHGMFLYIPSDKRSEQTVIEDEKIRDAGGEESYYKKLHSDFYNPSLESEYPRDWATEVPNRILRSKFSTTWPYRIVKHSRSLGMEQLQYVEETMANHRDLKPLMMNGLITNIGHFGQEVKYECKGLRGINSVIVEDKVYGTKYDFSRKVALMIGENYQADIAFNVQYVAHLDGYMATGLNVYLNRLGDLRVADGSWRNECFIKCDKEGKKFQIFRKGGYKLYLPQISDEVPAYRTD